MSGIGPAGGGPLRTPPARVQRRGPRLLLSVLIWLGLALALGVGAIVALNLHDEASIRPDIAPSTSAEVIARGAYVARVGNCQGCHSVPGGAPFAGGSGVKTPFGVVHAGNLTPDPATGLGAWSADHFWRALHNGRSRDGRLLYPAFPYPHFTRVSRDDSDALFAFLSSLPPVSQGQRAHELRWPYRTQWALAVWRALYFDPGAKAADPAHSPDWNRGEYLVNGLAHCSACHGTRNAWGAIADDEAFSGGRMHGSNWYAPSLIDPREAAVPHWSTPDIARLLREGRNSHASASGPMADVVQGSTQHMTDADLAAIAAYLRGLGVSTTRPIDLPAAAQTASAVAARPGPGAKIYEKHCADCHGAGGTSPVEGIPTLLGNRAVLMRRIDNLVQIVLGGGFGATTLAQPRPYGMPPFVTILSDQEVADVLSHVRTSWGHAAAPVQAFDVARLRGSLAR